VHLNGDSVRACTVLAVQAEGATITTIEGLARNDELHPLQEGFWEQHGLQCGFCTPGMIMAAADLLRHNPYPTDEAIRFVHHEENVVLLVVCHDDGDGCGGRGRGRAKPSPQKTIHRNQIVVPLERLGGLRPPSSFR
jgi:hypothetical protein